MNAISLIPVLCVATGGAVGSVLRYLVVQLTAMLHSQPFPFGTMIVNVAGSLAIGLLMARYVQFDSESSRLFFVTSVLGGFTTFSAFSWDALQLVQRGQVASAGVYVLGSVVASFAAVAIGFQIGR